MAAGQSFTNTYNATGQLTSVTGAGYAATEQTFASGMQYRAWGALKGATYGNGTTLALSYNTRGLMTHYGVGGVTQDGNYGALAHGSDYEYYADGQVKFASDLFTDALTSTASYKLHDRAYSYDQVGRLKEGYSGSEANLFKTGVASGVDGAFRQTYGYSAWGEMTSRTGRFWSEDDNDSETFDLRGRNTAWEYDADGRFISRNEAAPDTLPYEALRQSYDAAGRPSTTTQKTSMHSLANQNIIITTQFTRTESYDGDGVVVKQATQTTSNLPPAGVIYYLRSSVMGGQVIAELDEQGRRQRSYVFAGGTLIATHDSSLGLLWNHKNPVTGDEMETDSQGVVTGKETLDPMGVNLGDSNPFDATSGGSGDEGGMSQAQINKMYAQLLPASMGGGGIRVKVDGLETSASFASALVSMGAAGVGPSQTVRWNPNIVGERGARGAFEFYHAFGNGYSGWMTAYGYSHYEGGASFYNSAYDDYWENKSQLTRSPDVFSEHAGAPQNPTGGSGKLNPKQSVTKVRIPCDAVLPADAEHLAMVYTIMHEGTSPANIGKQEYGTDKKRSGAWITASSLQVESQLIANAIKNYAIANWNGSVFDAVHDDEYINDGTNKAEYYWDKGVGNTYEALGADTNTKLGAQLCDQLKRAIYAAAHPFAGLPSDIQHWKGVQQKHGYI